MSNFTCGNAKISQPEYVVGLANSFVAVSLLKPARLCYNNKRAEVAQSVEQRTENPRVASSILAFGTIWSERQ